MTYLGRVVGQCQIHPVDAKVRAVEQYPVPCTKKELMCFLGLAGYYQTFCKNFSTVIASLTDLLKGKVKNVRSPHCQAAFENVKSLLCSALVLAAPCLDKPFKIQVAASQVGVEAVLLQETDRVDRPVCYFSKKFNLYQCNYSAIEREALALPIFSPSPGAVGIAEVYEHNLNRTLCRSRCSYMLFAKVSSASSTPLTTQYKNWFGSKSSETSHKSCFRITFHYCKCKGNRTQVIKFIGCSCPSTSTQHQD